MVEEIKKEGFMIKKVIIFMYLKPSFFLLYFYSDTVKPPDIFFVVLGSHSPQLEIEMVCFIHKQIRLLQS